MKKSQESPDDDASTRAIAFRSICKVSTPAEEEEAHIRSNDCLKPWIYAFFVMTTDRQYLLYAKSEQDRAMWVAAFQYLTSKKNHALNALN